MDYTYIRRDLAASGLMEAERIIAASWAIIQEVGADGRHATPLRMIARDVLYLMARLPEHERDTGLEAGLAKVVGEDAA